MSGFGKCCDRRQSRLLCDFPKVLTDKSQVCVVGLVLVEYFVSSIKRVPESLVYTSTLNTGETSSNYYSVKLSLSPHKSSHGTFLDSLTIDFFKIPDVNQPLKRRHTAPAFHTMFY